MMHPITIDNYNYESWNTKFNAEDFKFSDLVIPQRWRPFMNSIIDDKWIDGVEEKIRANLSDNAEILPYPDLVFRTFELVDPQDVKVVFIGQDPYFNKQSVGNNEYPEATGVAFSTPIGIPIPSSAINIHKNLHKYHHLAGTLENSNFEFWNQQGCLMLNTALTVIEGRKLSHCDIWRTITDAIIHKLSDMHNHLVFVTWGAYAFNKLNFVDLSKHEAIISSHPSGLSVSKPFKEYPAFQNLDHFGKINKLLEKHHQTAIMWQPFDTNLN